MYPLLLFHVINFLVFVGFWSLTGCLKTNKKGKEKKKTLEPTPIAYETDPAILEKERKQKAVESRERMKKKREKMRRTQATAAVVQKTAETPELHEDSTQPSGSEDTNEHNSIHTAEDIVMDRTNNQNSDDEGQKIAHMNLKSDSEKENLGDVQLVNNVPVNHLDAYRIKKQARDAAKKKQDEEARRRKFLMEEQHSPDDTLKNVSSIQYESQISIIRKKKMEMEQKDKTNPDTTESHTKVAELVEPKSNELYARELAAKVAGR